MRLCVDASSFLMRSAGVKNYVYYWLRALQDAAGADQVTAFPRLPVPSSLHHDESSVGWFGTKGRLAGLLASNVPGLPVLDGLIGEADLFHASNQTRQPPSRMPLTATLYDMTVWLMPEMHTPGNIRAEREYAERILPRARAILSISEHSKQDALQLLPLQAERIHVIYPGVPEAYFSVSDEEAQQVATHYGLSPHYALIVGTVEPRKNVDTLLAAYTALRQGDRRELQLVVAGPIGWAKPETVRLLHEGEPHIRYLGYVPEQHLPGLTRAATMFVYPSLYEGFGFPLAQAMAAGVPAITSTASCLPEVAGDGALLVDPRSAEELRRAMEKLLDDASLRARLSQAARQQAQRYRWQHNAERSWAIFRQIVESR